MQHSVGETRGVMPDDQQVSLLEINNIYIIVNRRFFLYNILQATICPIKEASRQQLAETLLISSDSTNDGWHGNSWIAQKSAIKTY